MPAVSKAQQKLFAIVKAYKDGKRKDVDDKVKDIASNISDKDATDMASTSTKNLPDKVKKEENVEETAERDYKAEYKKFQSSPQKKKYRAELTKYNRDKGTYGNGDGKDASHKGGKIVGFEAESKNRGRAEKSRLKKENKVTEKLREIIRAEITSLTEANIDYVHIFSKGGGKYSVMHSNHDKLQLGGQVLKNGLNIKQATSLGKQLATKWKGKLVVNDKIIEMDLPPRAHMRPHYML